MKKQKKKKILDVIMILVIMVIMVSGIMAAKSFKESKVEGEAAEIVHNVESKQLQKEQLESESQELETEELEQQEPETEESEQQEPEIEEPETEEPEQQEPETEEPEQQESETEEPEQQESEIQKYSCTIKISCETILDNKENLQEGKESYVPSSGVILATTTVNFEEGETVFDVLKRICSSKGIQLEYSWTPMYDSYYIEGINQIYEFDCGGQSGWMYKVNGCFPNYGCSSYILEDGDTIVWCYTCNGLGADVGGSANY